MRSATSVSASLLRTIGSGLSTLSTPSTGRGRMPSTPGATVVASTDTDSETVYKVVRSLFENFNHFRKLHPAFAKLKEEDMITRMLSAPLHAGALRYYKERGWR